MFLPDIPLSYFQAGARQDLADEVQSISDERSTSAFMPAQTGSGGNRPGRNPPLPDYLGKYLRPIG
jgi:hypothetical protein